MKKDERVQQDIYFSKSIGYQILWFGLFGVLLYRWFYLDQSLNQTLDIFILWLGASIIQFLLMANKGVSMTYPIVTSKKDQRLFVIVVSLATGLVTAIIVFFISDEIRRVLFGFLFSSLGTFTLFSLYYMLTDFFDKKILDED